MRREVRRSEPSAQRGEAVHSALANPGANVEQHRLTDANLGLTGHLVAELPAGIIDKLSWGWQDCPTMDTAMNDPVRCRWAGGLPLMVDYHDTEWGVPLHDDRRLFEFFILEGAQAGLSWTTILKKRVGYLRAFDGFDAARMTAYGSEKIKELLGDSGIVRNRLKIATAIGNTTALLAVQREFGNYDAYIWGFVEGQPRRNT